MDCEKKDVTIIIAKHNLNTNDNVKTSQFMMMKKTINGQTAKSETTSIECKQDPVVNESSDAKMKMKQRLFLDEHQCQDSNF